MKVPFSARELFTAPIFEDEERTRVARLLDGALWILLAATVLGSAVVIVVEPPSEMMFSLAFGVLMSLVILALRYFLHRGYVQTIGLMLSLVLWTGITVLLYASGGLANVAVVSYFLLIGITGLLLGESFGLVIAFLTFLAMLGLFYAENNGLIEPAGGRPTELTDLVVLSIALLLATLMVRFIVRTINQGLERARRNEEILRERNRELEASQRVTLAASERVSPDELLGLVVDMIRDQFHLYHVQAYVVDEEQEAAVLRQSTGYAGYQLLQEGHRIPLDRSALVTEAIREGRPVRVDDVDEEPAFLPNPLLPDTKSELVVPLKIGERVIGVLDAQARTRERFSESTMALFQTMAGQIAFLFENSELLKSASEQTQRLTNFTNRLRTAADIALQLGTILDPEEVLQQAVDLMQGRFGLYHAHVYVLDADSAAGDEEEKRLIVKAGSGEVGRVLQEQGYSLSFDAEKSLVAQAARTQELVLINDTSLESDFRPTPLLSQTRSEMSVPLVASGELLGVLDLQDDQPNRFSQADRDAISILSGQVASALQNARLFEELQGTSQAIEGERA